MLRAFLISTILISSFILRAQDANNLAVDGTVKDETGERVVGASISLFQDGKLINKVSTGKNGRFDLFLEYNHEFIIEISRVGYVSKKLYFNTKGIPADEQLWAYEYGGFIIDLLKKIPEIDYSILDKPIGKVYYDPNIKTFADDRLYTKEIRSQLDELQAEYNKRIKNEALASEQSERNYLLAIKDAEAAMADGDLLTAKENYLAAASLKPSEAVPKNKIVEIDKRLASEGKKEEQYLSALATADQLYGQDKFEEAKLKYQEASTIKPSEAYPKTRILESDKAMAALKAKLAAESQAQTKQTQYETEIKKADELFYGSKYQEAKTAYQSALAIIPDQVYPKDQLKAVELKLAELAKLEVQKKAQSEIDARYAAQLDKADAAFKSGQLANAKTMYEAAKAIKSAETYPDTQIALIEKSIEQEKDKLANEERLKKEETTYKTIISEADKLFVSKSYEASLSKYNEATALRPTEPYLKEQVSKIQALLGDIALKNQQEKEIQLKEANYKNEITQGDAKLKSLEYDAAITFFTNASKLKPTEVYPKQQIELAQQLKAKGALDANYSDLIAKADENFKSEKYNDAKTGYESALALKSGEKYPRDQIMAIAQKQKNQAESDRLAAAQAERDKNYNDAIAAANALFEDAKFNEAKDLYTKALGIKANEVYPKEQIAFINEKITKDQAAAQLAAEQEKLNSQYQSFIKSADEQFALENLEAARSSYNLAAGAKPAEKYPKDQIAAIDAKINEANLAKSKLEQDLKNKEAEERTNKHYELLMTEAQAFMDNEDYELAKLKCVAAKSLKPSEQKPNEFLALIEQRMAESESKQKNEEDKRLRYSNFIKDGDRAIATKDWDEARKAYASAIELYPDETFPKGRLSEIDDLQKRSEDETKTTEFNAIVNVADRAFIARDYENALLSYNKALLLINSDAHCLDRIARINQILSASDKKVDEKVEIQEKQITEETYEEGRSQVTIRRVTLGDKTEVYKRVVHSWGGKYYFQNDRPVTELVWNKETTQ